MRSWAEGLPGPSQGARHRLPSWSEVGVPPGSSASGTYASPRPPLRTEASALRDRPQRGRLETDPKSAGVSRLAVKASPPTAHRTCPGWLVSRCPGEPGPGGPGARVGEAGATRHHLGHKGSGGRGGRSRPGDLGPDATWPRSRVQHRPSPPGPGPSQGAGLLLHPPAPSTPGPGRVPRQFFAFQDASPSILAVCILNCPAV